MEFPGGLGIISIVEVRQSSSGRSCREIQNRKEGSTEGDAKGSPREAAGELSIKGFLREDTHEELVMT